MSFKKALIKCNAVWKTRALIPVTKDYKNIESIQMFLYDTSNEIFAKYDDLNVLTNIFSYKEVSIGKVL